MTDFTLFLKQLNAVLSSRLSEVGFRRTKNGTWWRQTGENINVIWIQKGRWEKECCINLGIHYAFMPKGGSNDLPTGNRITQPECEIHLRLTENDSLIDQWWPLSTDSADEISQLIMERGLDVFTAYQLEGQIRELEAEDVFSGHADLLKELTKTRACLVLARIHEHLKQPAQSVQAARLGLENIGRGVALIKEFNDIIKRQESAL